MQLEEQACEDHLANEEQGDDRDYIDNGERQDVLADEGREQRLRDLIEA